MPLLHRKHPIIRAIAIVAILGGLVTMGRSLMLLQTALEQNGWPVATLYKDSREHLVYRVGEQDFVLSMEHQQRLRSNASLIFYNPETPAQILLERPNFWWPLYLSMAGLIVFYAGLHLLREKDRNLEALSFE